LLFDAQLLYRGTKNWALPCERLVRSKAPTKNVVQPISSLAIKVQLEVEEFGFPIANTICASELLGATDTFWGTVDRGKCALAGQAQIYRNVLAERIADVGALASLMDAQVPLLRAK
jgi:hypothetical protein